MGLEDDKKVLLGAVQMAHRKHVFDDQSVGWGELSEKLSDALSSVMGVEAYNTWIDEVGPDSSAADM